MIINMSEEAPIQSENNQTVVRSPKQIEAAVHLVTDLLSKKTDQWVSAAPENAMRMPVVASTALGASLTATAFAAKSKTWRWVSAIGAGFSGLYAVVASQIGRGLGSEIGKLREVKNFLDKLKRDPALMNEMIGKITENPGWLNLEAVQGHGTMDDARMADNIIEFARSKGMISASNDFGSLSIIIGLDTNARQLMAIHDTERKSRRQILAGQDFAR
jgi:hypothetical protein